MTVPSPDSGESCARNVGGIIDVELDPPDGLIVTCDGGPDGTRTRLAFDIGELPAFLLQLQSAGLQAVERLGSPVRQPFLSISRLEVLRTEGVFAMVLHMGQTRVPLQLSARAARELADTLSRWIPSAGDDDGSAPPALLN